MLRFHPRYKHQRRFMHECLNLTLSIAREYIYILQTIFGRIRASLQHDASWTILRLKLTNQICLTSANWAINFLHRRPCTGAATTGSRHIKNGQISKREPSKYTVVVLSWMWPEQTEIDTIIIVIRHRSPHEAMPGSSAHADASLLLHRYGIVDFASHPRGKEAKFSLKETSSQCGRSQPTKSKLPSRTHHEGQPFRSKEEGNGYRPRTVPGSSRGREEKLANYCGWE